MNCTNFELAVQERQDLRRIELTDELRAHAASCAACRSFWQDQRRLLAATKSWTRVEMPVDLLDAVTRELSAEARPAVVVIAQRRAAARSSGWVAVCSTAALILLVAALMRIGPTSNLPRQPVALIQPIPSQAIDAPQAPMIAGLLTGVQTEYLEFAQSTTRVLDEWSELPHTSDLIPNFSDSAAMPLESTPAWPRLDRPVSDRVGQAFDFLWDVLPHDASRSS